MSRTKELEARLESAEQQVGLLQKISRYMVRDVPLAKALGSVAALVVEFMRSDSCLLYLCTTRSWYCARPTIRSPIPSATFA